MADDKTVAGIVTVGEERWIPGSRRADGSYRKEQKVRPGFTPAEDVIRYSNSRIARPAETKSQYPPGYNPKKKATPASTPKTPKTPKKEPEPKSTNVAVDGGSTKSPEEKKIKALQKKLREITELEQKRIKGEELNAAQLEKMKKGKSVREELAKLTQNGDA
ncbi:uncharacterized protein BYT42DRAFT_552483 [Radiomyces spectabilis]|uniref:uncharacterized protein n=1 Tax=Radiomyces spectabilis TaxID=64574 RepID=UPI00221FCAC0|nr:uncharacterized protein BYT42DRAFT_552483 [Radiomyces spectabilis]KAI8393858.1 hypothetical protein BYT42DRAFT_552483 [Radiomyces spectabilis]